MLELPSYACTTGSRDELNEVRRMRRVPLTPSRGFRKKG